MKYRDLRLKKLIREELGKLIEREVDTHGALVSITDVELDGKLERAHVKVSVLPVEKEDGVLRELRAQKEELRRALMKHVPMKYFPQIAFSYDPGLENAARVEKLLIEGENRRKAR